MAKKRNTNEGITETETITVVEADITNSEEAEEIIIPDEEDQSFADLLAALQEIRKSNGVLGYILKSDTKATVDLEDPAKIIEYAMLSSQAFESSEALSASFSLGEIENVLIEATNIKALCINLGQCKLSLFMEKNADHAGILEMLLPRLESAA